MMVNKKKSKNYEKDFVYFLLTRLARSISFLPYKLIMCLVFLMRLLRPLFKKDINIVKTNLKIAFPEKNYKEISQMEKKCFDSKSFELCECIITGFMSNRRFHKIKFERENFDTFETFHNDSTKTVIILGTHFHTLNICGRFMGMNYQPFNAMYKDFKKFKRLSFFLKKTRGRYITNCFNNSNFFGTIKSLKKHHTLWYAPDEDHGRNNSIFVPFFSKLCATLTVTPWLAKQTNAIVIPLYTVRKSRLSGYKMVFGDPIEFTDDEYYNAILVNKKIEEFIKKCPEQYNWQHKRFNTRPDGEERIY